MIDQGDSLKLENQIDFLLYACAKEVVKAYKPYLDELDLTYTQYLAMRVMWEQKERKIREVGARLYLDSATLTPLFKKLEDKGYVARRRSKDDRRDAIVTITDKGVSLMEKAVSISEQFKALLKVEPENLQMLYGLLNDLLDKLTQ